MQNNPKKVMKLALNSQILTVQILTNNVQVPILCLSYSIDYYYCTLQLIVFGAGVAWINTILTGYRVAFGSEETKVIVMGALQM